MKFKCRTVIFMISALLLVAVAGGAAIFAKMSFEQSKMRPLPTGEVIPGIIAVNNQFVNFYLLQGENGYLMIDAGNSVEETEAALMELNILPEEVTAILLTHSDSDHVSALPLFEQATIYLPALEETMVNGETKRSILGYNQLYASYNILQDNEKIEIEGFSILSLATPGHTPGSMCYQIDETYLFIGDGMSLSDDGQVELFNAFYNMDGHMQAQSIRELAARVQADYIFTGHYGYADDIDKAFSDWYSNGE